LKLRKKNRFENDRFFFCVLKSTVLDKKRGVPGEGKLLFTGSVERAALRYGKQFQQPAGHRKNKYRIFK
jgi:hypothetical protein